MKQLHRKDLYGWSEFNPDRNLDFHSILWIRPEGNVLIDPLHLSAHDLNHLRELGGAKYVIVTNSDHCRDAFHIAKMTGAELYGPKAECKHFPLECQHWISDNETIVPGLIAYEVHGSKTPGELALVLEETTLITGDLIRSHLGGELCLLPDGKLTDKTVAIQSALRLTHFPKIETVLVGDGWPIFKNGKEALDALANVITNQVSC